MEDDRRQKTVGKQWERVHDLPPLDARAYELYKKREATLKNPVFIAACNKSGMDITIRQARKWNARKGSAFKFGREEQGQ